MIAHPATEPKVEEHPGLHPAELPQTSAENPTVVRPTLLGRTLLIEVDHDDDPVRFARIASARVNNTRMALREVHVGSARVYPVMNESAPITNRRELTFTMRDANATLDHLLIEEVVGIVSSMASALTVRRGP